MGMPRLLKVKAKPSGTPASFKSFRASARAALMSLPYPASLASSSGGVANGVPGTWTPATSLTMAICERALDPA
jgi:hypothetical protein